MTPQVNDEQAQLLWSIPDAARRLGIGRTKVYELIKTDRLSVVKIGKRTLVPDSELRRFVWELMPHPKMMTIGYIAAPAEQGAAK